MTHPSMTSDAMAPLRVVVVTRYKESIDVDVGHHSTIGDIRAAAAVIAQHKLYALTFNGSALADDWVFRPGYHNELHEMRPSGWFSSQRAMWPGTTAFHVAAQEGHLTCLNVLLQRFPEGAIVKNDNGESPLHYAAYEGQHVCLFSLLSYLPRGGDMGRLFDGRTPLHVAVESGQDVCLAVLLQHFPEGGAETTHDHGGMLTPFHYAAKLNQSTCLTQLLRYCPQGATVKDNKGLTPFHYAARLGHDACLELLLPHCPREEGSQEATRSSVDTR